VSFYFYTYFIPRSRDRVVTQSHAHTHTRSRTNDELAMRDVSMQMFVGYRNVEVCKNCSRHRSAFVIFALSPLVIFIFCSASSAVADLQGHRIFLNSPPSVIQLTFRLSRIRILLGSLLRIYNDFRNFNTGSKSFTSLFCSLCFLIILKQSLSLLKVCE